MELSLTADRVEEANGRLRVRDGITDTLERVPARRIFHAYASVFVLYRFSGLQVR